MESACTLGSPLIVIENFEAKPSRWLIAEYTESYRVARDRGFSLLVAGISDPTLASLLESRGIPYLRERGSTVCASSRTIVADLRAEKPLTSHEAMHSCCIVIGGILGDHPPRGRGLWLRLVYPDAAYRNLGYNQFSIDGAVKVILELLGGKELGDVEICHPARIKLDSLPSRPEIILPYAYPLREGKPWIAPELRSLLERGLMWEEAF